MPRYDFPTRLRAVLVIPEGTNASSYIFSRRQAALLQHEGVEVLTFFVKSRTSPRTIAAEWRRLRREIREFQPDVVHAQYGTMNSFLTAAASTVPLVITFRGSDLNPVPSINPLRNRAGHLLSQLSTLRAAAVLCVSTELMNRLWWCTSKASVLVGGVNTEVFHPIPQAEARQRLGWDAEPPVVLFNAGKHPRVKRLDLAEAAIAEAKLKRPEVTMVTLRGDVDPDRMPLYYNAADCLLVTSDWEGSPTTIKEALACNLPVVSVPVGDAAERLCHVSPSAIAARNKEALADALLDVLASRQRCNGREAVADLSELGEVKKIRLLYESLCHARSARGSCLARNGHA